MQSLKNETIWRPTSAKSELLGTYAVGPTNITASLNSRLSKPPLNMQPFKKPCSASCYFGWEAGALI